MITNPLQYRNHVAASRVVPDVSGVLQQARRSRHVPRVILTGCGMEEATKGTVETSQRCSRVSPEGRRIEFGSAACDNTIEE